MKPRAHPRSLIRGIATAFPVLVLSIACTAGGSVAEQSPSRSPGYIANPVAPKACGLASTADADMALGVAASQPPVSSEVDLSSLRPLPPAAASYCVWADSTNAYYVNLTIMAFHSASEAAASVAKHRSLVADTRNEPDLGDDAYSSGLRDYESMVAPRGSLVVLANLQSYGDEPRLRVKLRTFVETVLGHL
jgi:hypothetical protein